MTFAHAIRHPLTRLLHPRADRRRRRDTELPPPAVNLLCDDVVSARHFRDPQAACRHLLQERQLLPVRPASAPIAPRQDLNPPHRPPELRINSVCTSVALTQSAATQRATHRTVTRRLAQRPHRRARALELPAYLSGLSSALTMLLILRDIFAALRSKLYSTTVRIAGATSISSLLWVAEIAIGHDFISNIGKILLQDALQN